MIREFGRWIFLLTVALCLAGCSSPHKLVVHNDTDSLITVRVSWMEDGVKDSQEWSLGAGEAEQKLVWFYEAPPSFLAEVTGPKNSQQRFSAPDYPEAMRAKTSMGPTCHLHISSGRAELSGPTAWDRFEANEPVYLGGVCLLAPFGLMWLLVSRQRRVGAKVA